LTTIGIAIGIGIALMLTRVMSAFLFGVGPMDPITYAALSAVLAGMTLVATYLPAHRASRVDPVVRPASGGLADFRGSSPRRQLGSPLVQDSPVTSVDGRRDESP
jgi:hypothetical protein